MTTIEGSAKSTGSPDAVWALLADGEAWTRWGSWSENQIEGGGEQGPGKVRVIVRKPYRVRERITEWEPGRRFGYEMLDGMKVQGYRSEITLEPEPEGGTRVRWRSTYDKASPLTAVLLRLAIRDSVKRLAKAASATT